MPQPMQGPPTSRGTLQRGPNGFVVKSSAPAPQRPQGGGGLSLKMNVEPDAIVGGMQEFAAQIAQALQMQAQVSQQSAAMIANEIAQLRAAILSIRPQVNVTSPDVNVSAPQVTVNPPTINVPPSVVNFQPPPPREKKIDINFDAEGNATGTVK